MYIDYFDRFYNMEPYLYISPEEWEHIKKTYDIEDIKESLATVAMTYPLPYVDLTIEDAQNDFLKLKGVRWNEMVYEAEWFSRSALESDYPLIYNGPLPYGDTNKFILIKRNNIGNNASNYFQQKNRWTVSSTQGPGPSRTWVSHKFMTTMMGALFSLDMSEVSKKTLKACLHLRKYTCAQFKPNVAKVFYEMMKAETTLDFSMGWGDRLAGFFAASGTKRYIGLDPRKENHPIYKEQQEFYEQNLGWFEDKKICEIHMSPAEDFDFTPYYGEVDLIFTSPPYFNLEQYSTDDTQSWIRYKRIDDWNENFLHKALGKMIPTLKKGGFMAINISDVYTNSGGSREPQSITNPMNDYLSNQGLIFQGCIGMEMAKRPNSGGAGTARKNEQQNWSDKSLDLAKEKNDKKFAEPIWIWKREN